MTLDPGMAYQGADLGVQDPAGGAPAAPAPFTQDFTQYEGVAGGQQENAFGMFGGNPSVPGDPLTQALTLAPELSSSPALAVAAGQTPDPAGTAQAFSVAIQQASLARVKELAAQANADQGGNWLSDAAGEALHVLSAPLREVQHLYRTLHMVYTQRGLFQGALDTVAVLAPALIAGIATGGAGTALGGILTDTAIATGTGELAGEAVLHAAQPGLYAQAQNANISPGRDLVGLLRHIDPSLDAHSGVGQVISGIADAAFDITGDPLIVAGKLRAVQVSADGLRSSRLAAMARKAGDTNATLRILDQTMTKVAPGLRVTDAQGVEDAFNQLGSRFKTWAKSVASVDDAGTLAAKHPELSVSPTVLQKFVEAKSAEDVKQLVQHLVEGTHADMPGLLGMPSSILPTRTLLGTKVFSPVAEAMRMAGGKVEADASRTTDATATPAVSGPVASTAGRVMGSLTRSMTATRPLDFSDLSELNGKSFDPYGPHAAKIVGDTMRMSNMPESMVREYVSDFVKASAQHDEASMKQIWDNGVKRMIAYAMPDSPGTLYDMWLSQAKRLWGKTTEATHGPSEVSEMYAHGYVNKDAVDHVPTANGDQVWGLYQHQAQIRFAIPDFMGLRSFMRDASWQSAKADVLNARTEAGEKWGVGNAPNRFLRTAKAAGPKATVQHVYGNLDDFFSGYMNKVFKPLALLTGGFGLRVASSELIQQLIRNGAWKTAGDYVRVAMAKARYIEGVKKNVVDAGEKLTSLEIGHMTAALGKVAGGVDKIAHMKQQDVQALVDMLWRNDGHFLTGPVNTGGANTIAKFEDPVEAARKTAAWAQQWSTGRWKAYAPSEGQNYVDAWHMQLQRIGKTSDRHIFADYSVALHKGLSAEDATQYVEQREALRLRNAATGMGPYSEMRNMAALKEAANPTVPGEWSFEHLAQRRVDGVRNLLADDTSGVLNKDIAEMVGGGDEVPVDWLRDAVKSGTVPRRVVGPEWVPIEVGSNVINSIIQKGYKTFIDPIISHVSREPIFAREYLNEFKALEPQIDKLVTRDQAITLAMTRATRGMIKMIHVPELRSQFGMLARNIFPFYFAQEQAFKRAGHLIKSNPQAFGTYQLAAHALSTPGWIGQDANGNSAIVLPGMSTLGHWFQKAGSALGIPMMGALPISVMGSTLSLKSVFPGVGINPTDGPIGVSPLVSVPANWLAAMHPHWNVFNDVVKGAVGDIGYRAPVLAQLLPSTVLRSVVEANGGFGGVALNNAIAGSLAAAYYHGQGDDPTKANYVPGPEASEEDRQAFMDRIKHNAMSMLYLQALVAGVSPLSPHVEQTDVGLRNDYLDLVKKYGGDASAAMQEFVAKHGSRSVSYTVARSTGPDGESAYPVTQGAQDWINGNPDIVQKYPYAAPFLVPQVGAVGDAKVVFNEQLSMGLRERMAPKDFLNAIYAKQGQQAYYAALDTYEKQHTTLLRAGDKSGAANLNKIWNDWNNGFAVWNPVAWKAINDPAKKVRAMSAAEQLQTVTESGQLPQGEQGSAIGQLVAAYAQHKQNLADISAQKLGTTYKTQENDLWQQYLIKYAANPLVSDLVTQVYKRL